MKQKVFLCTVLVAALASSAAYAVPEYYVPWPCGVVHEVTQGNNNEFSHNSKTSKYAWDISMDEGDDISAPLDGKVIKVVESNVASCYKNGSCDTACLNSANYLVLCVTDRNGNEFGLHFAHMVHNGIDVEEGQMVKQGQVIAHAGKTGCATGNHLHITATETCQPWSQSIASSWIDIGVPQKGQKITSNNCPVTCVPTYEICGDGIDNDCDGEIDEPSEEICDGKDNDCDGHADNGFEICAESYHIKYQVMNYDPQNTDINGDGMADICIRGKKGIECMISDGKDYTKYTNVLPEMKDGSVWSGDKYYRSIRFADINGDGMADLCARNKNGVLCWPSTGTSFGEPTVVLPMSDADMQVSGDDGSINPSAKAYLATLRFGDINGDGKDDVCVLSKKDNKEYVCYLSNGNGFDKKIIIDEFKNNDWLPPKYSSTIRMADVDGDGLMDICGRGESNVLCWFSEGDKFTAGVIMNNWAAKDSWKEQRHYGTIRFADVNGDDKADICGRDAKGIVCQLSAGRVKFGKEIRGPEWSDDKGWKQYDNYSTIMFGDLNGDGKADVCGRSDEGISCHLSSGSDFKGGEYKIDAFSDKNGWDKPEHFRTLRMADINGDGKADICGRGANGVQCFLFNGTGFKSVAGPAWKDAGGWNDPSIYSTLRLGGPLEKLCSKRAEICGDEIDNNCNGQIDEDCAPECTPSEEVCDGIDNDCNGEVDDGLDCNPSECVPSEEVCDGIDNDCNGEVDDVLDCNSLPEDDCNGNVDEDGICHPVDTCVSPDGCPDENQAKDFDDEDCGCSVKRTPVSSGGGALLFGLLGALGMAGLRRRRK